MAIKKQRDDRRRTAGRTGTTRRGAQRPGALRPTEDWITADERMTLAQSAHLSTLSAEAGEAFDDSLTKAQASERIEELLRLTGRAR